MSYLALARKWRPRRFEDVRGQGHVVKALSHALDGDRLHPAILLTGTRGVGKTTLARIIAKGLNCETGVSANPCGICTSCKEVNDGRFIDLLEIDAASNTGVENVRDLIENAQYPPVRGRYKVYLIDEVHMLSKAAFNALLKTLEEPPPHLKFILATTDPQKLLITVLSRCLQFNLKRLTPTLIRDNLGEILKAEGIAYEPGAIAEIARAADGSMRDGLSLLDQAIAFSGGAEVKQAAVEDMLGTGGRRNLFAVLDALAVGDGAALLAAIQRLDEAAPDYAALLNDLAGYLQRLAMLQILPDAADEDDDPQLAPLAQRIAIEDVQVWYQIAVMGRRDLPYAPDPRLGFEMALLRMFALRPDDGAAPAAAGSGGGRVVAAASSPSSAARASAVAAAVTPARTLTETSKPAAAVIAPEQKNTEPVGRIHAPAVVVESAQNSVVARAPLPTATHECVLQDSAGSGSRDDGAVNEAAWPELIETLGLDVMTRQFARHCAWLGIGIDGELRLVLDAKVKHLMNDNRCAAITRALQASTAAPSRVQIEIATGRETVFSPAAQEERGKVDRQRSAEMAIESDPEVRSFREAFGATIRPLSIQPIDP